MLYAKIFEQGIIHCFYIPCLREGLIFADTNEAGIELMKIKYSSVDLGKPVS